MNYYNLTDEERYLLDKDPLDLWKDFCKLSEKKLNIKLPRFLTWKILSEILIINNFINDDEIKKHDFLKRKEVNNRLRDYWKNADES